MHMVALTCGYCAVCSFEVLEGRGAFIRGVLNYSIISPLWILKLFTLQKKGGHIFE